MDPLFSVLIVNYEQTHLLKKCLESVFNQSYTNIELIVCDDASCDFDPDEMSVYIDKMKGDNIKKVVVFKQDRYTGLSAIHQKAFELSSGLYVKYLMSSDKLIGSSALLRAQEAFVDIDADILATKAVVVNHDNETKVEVQDIAQYKDNNINPAIVFSDLATQHSESFIFSPAAFIKREIIERAGGFDRKYEQVVFFQLWLKASLAGARFCYTEQKMTAHTTFNATTFQPQITDTEKIAKNQEYLDILDEIVRPVMKKRFSMYVRLKHLILVRRIEEDMILVRDWACMNVFEKAVWKISHLGYMLLKSLYTIRTTTFSLKNISIALLLLLILLKTDLPTGPELPIRETVQVFLYVVIFAYLVNLSFILFQKVCDFVARRRYENK